MCECDDPKTTTTWSNGKREARTRQDGCVRLLWSIWATKERGAEDAVGKEEEKQSPGRMNEARDAFEFEKVADGGDQGATDIQRV